MNFYNIFRIVTVNSIKCIRAKIPTSIQTRQFPRQFQTKTLEPIKEDVISNLRKKFGCNEEMAKEIFSKCPSLRSVNAIECDSLEFLRDKVSAQSIIENPLLVTMDIEMLKRKIVLVQSLNATKLEDILPLLILDENKLEIFVKKLLKDENDIEQKNRIYYISEKLQVEPKVISKCRADSRYELFRTSFRSIKKILNILLDYEVSRMDILKSLYVLGCDDRIFVPRLEQMVAARMPIKLCHFKLSDNKFNEVLRKYRLLEDTKKTAYSENQAKQMKKRHLEKAIIVDALMSLLQCDEIEASEFYYNYVNEMSELETAEKNIKYLLKIPISLETIKDNGFLLTMPIDEIEENVSIVMEMGPKNIKHFIPLMNVESDELREYKCRLKKLNAIGCDHPIYYFSEKLNIAAKEVAMHFVEKKSAFLDLTPTKLKQKLDALLNNNVKPSSILKCGNTFRYYSVQNINVIVSKLRSSGIEKISAWMILSPGCPVYENLIANHTREMETLHGFESSTAYLAHHLNWDLSSIKTYPRLSKLPAIRIKEYLDYFLNETKFTAHDLKQYPRIFQRNLDTLKARINDLTDIGAPITMTNILYDRKRYLKIIRKYCEVNLDEKQCKRVFQMIQDREYSK